MIAHSLRRAITSATARGLACGLTGTAAMTLTAACYARLRGESEQIIDYDTSEHVAIAAATVLRLHPYSAARERALFHLVHWGYGSAVGIAYEVIVHTVPSRRATAAIFFTGCQTMAFVLFPLLGRTPPPWRWKTGVIAISLLQHAVYAATVDLAHLALRPPARVSPVSSTAGRPGGPCSPGPPCSPRPPGPGPASARTGRSEPPEAFSLPRVRFA
jgi:hypothetical protein